MQLFTGILTNTPIWVWALFAFLMYRGWTMSRDRTVRPLTLFLIPGIFLLVDITQLALGLLSLKLLPMTFAGALAGVIAVFLLKPARSTVRLPDGKLLIAGEWASISLLLAVFLSNYASAVLSVVNPADAEPVRLVASTLNGFSFAFMLARSIAHLRTGSVSQAETLESC